MFKRFFRKWNESLQEDKQHHFYIGLLVGLTSILIDGMAINLIICIFVAVGIEFTQSFMHNRHVDSLDAYSVCAGWISARCVIEIIDFII